MYEIWAYDDFQKKRVFIGEVPSDMYGSVYVHKYITIILYDEDEDVLEWEV